MFTEKRRTPLPRYNGEGIFYVHDRTGMEVFHIRNNSTELCGDFIFATPSEDSTGVAHILEHTVLCGSGMYPVKDPFSQLLKSSPNTFLNAMTFLDKTMYPFASPLKKDFDNLFSVYADAVFNPLLRRQSFEQEGMRFLDGNIDGVVFNEMRGSMNMEDSLLACAINEKLFEGTPARYVSGGDPLYIADLTYEQYLERYRKWYSPSNCRLYLYGDMDAREYLDLLEGRYLGEDKLGKWTGGKIIPNPEDYKPKTNTPSRNSVTCPSKNASSVVLSWLTGPCSDPFEVQALSILTDLLLGNPGAPLYKAITESDLGEDLHPISGMSANSPYLTFTVGFTGAKAGREDEIEAFLLNSLEEIASRGFDSQEIEASLRNVEFSLKEIRGAGMPYGLTTALSVALYWIRGLDPEVALDPETLVGRLRRKVSEGRFFEDCIRRYFLDNPVRLLTSSTCDPDFEEKLQAALHSKYERNVRAVDPVWYGEEKKRFEDFVNTPDSPELLSLIPRIGLSDMPRRFPLYDLDTRPEGDALIGRARIFTNSIVYANFAFNAAFLSPDELEILPLFIRMLHMCGAGELDYSQVGNRLKLLTGGFSVSFMNGTGRNGENNAVVLVQTKALQQYFANALSLVHKILTQADFSSAQRIRDCLTDLITGYEQEYQDSGNYFAVMNASASLSSVMLVRDTVTGTRAWLNMIKLRKLDEKDIPDLSACLTNLRNKIFCRTGAIFEIGCSENDMEDNVNILKQSIYEYSPTSVPGTGSSGDMPLEKESKPSLLTLSSGPAFNARSIELEEESEELLIDDMLFASIISNGSLWNEIRGKGGAYGAGCYVDIQERLFNFFSYRDPSVMQTFDAFTRSLDTVVTKEEIEYTNVAILGRSLKPEVPSSYCHEALKRRIFGLTDNQYAMRRRRLLSLAPADLEKAAQRIRGFSHTAGSVICGADMVRGLDACALDARGLDGEVTELPL